MAVTRSQVIVRANITPAGFSQLGRPPSGWLWIMKSVSVQNNAGSTQTINVQVVDPTTSYAVTFFSATLDPFLAKSELIWTICEDVDHIQVSVPLGAASIWISGAGLPIEQPS